MASSVPTSGNTPGRTFMVTIWVVAGMVALQVMLIGWSILQRPASAIQGDRGGQPGTPAHVFTPGAQTQNSSVREDGILGRYIAPGAASPPAGSNPTSPPVFVLPPGRLIDDPGVLEVIDAGIRLRSEGDMLGALAALRNADSMQPDHPAILHELALTYRQMGLDEQAEQHIARILAMGDSGAGDYFAVWDMWLRGLNSGGGATPAAAMPVRALQLGRIEALRDPAVTQGEKIVLRIPIEASPGVSIDPIGVEVFVFFYDLVDGERIEQTTADEPTFLFVTSPVDWTGPEASETLEVVYFHPQLTPDQVRELGQRRFYGYVVKVFYQDQLQDQVADPASLADQRPAGFPPSSEGPASPLFPGAL